MNNLEKLIKINELLFDVDDILVKKFFDAESEKMLDEKIDVLTKLSQGIQPKDIPNYYSILELYPKEDNDENIIWD